MKLNKDDIILLAGSGLLGASIGFGTGLAISSKPAQVILSSLAGAVPGALIAYQVSDSLTSKKQLQTINKLNQAHNEALEKIKANLAKTSNQLDRLTQANQYLGQETKIIPQLKDKIAKLSTSLDEKVERIKILEEANQEWEQGFDSLLEKQSQVRGEQIAEAIVQKEVKSVFEHHDDFTQRAMKIALDMQKVVEESDTKNSALISHDQDAMLHYVSNIEDLEKQINEMMAAFEEEKNILKARVQYLQRQLNGELLEPVYGDHGYDIPAQIATDLCRNLWNTHKQPLRLEGVKTASNGLSTAGYGYGTNQNPTQLVGLIGNQSEILCQQLGIHAITKVEKLAIAPIISVSFRREPEIKDSDIWLYLGKPEQLVSYIENHPVRYRLIGNPGSGKTPLTEIIASVLINHKCHDGNVMDKPLCPHTLLTVSYPNADSSRKDTSYRLSRFLKYRNPQQCHQSFSDAVATHKWRVKNPNYGGEFFHIWIWDELDNTLKSHPNKSEAVDDLLAILKDGGHQSMGVICSGQSVMTSTISPKLKNDDRSLFTEIVIGVGKIRKYLKTYGDERGSKEQLKALETSLDLIADWLESKNKTLPKSKSLRVCLVVDDESMKYYMLPEFGTFNIPHQTVSNSEKRSLDFNRIDDIHAVHDSGQSKAETLTSKAISPIQDSRPDSPIGVNVQNGQTTTKYHCPRCNTDSKRRKGKDRFYCDNQDCKQKTFSKKTAIKR